MALPSFVNATLVTPGGTGTACTTTALATTTGSFLFVSSTHYTPGINISAVVDTVGNLYTRAGTVQGGDANQDNELWYTPSSIVGTASNSVIVRYTGTAAFRDVSQCQFSWGGTTSITYDSEAAHKLVSGSAQTSNTLSVAAEGLVIGNWVAYDDTWTVSNGTGTIIALGPTTALPDMVVAYRLFTLSSAAATIGIILGATGRTFSGIAKSFKAVAAGTSTPAAAPIHLTLFNSGQG